MLRTLNTIIRTTGYPHGPIGQSKYGFRLRLSFGFYLCCCGHRCLWPWKQCFCNWQETSQGAHNGYSRCHTYHIIHYAQKTGKMMIFGMSVQESNRVVVIQWDWEAGRYKKAQIMVLGIEKFFQPFPAPTAAFLFLLFLARTRWEERSASGGRNPRTALFWTISSWLVRWAVGLGLRGDNSSWAGLVGLYVLVLGSA